MQLRIFAYPQNQRLAWACKIHITEPIDRHGPKHHHQSQMIRRPIDRRRKPSLATLHLAAEDQWHGSVPYHSEIKHKAVLAMCRRASCTGSWLAEATFFLIWFGSDP